MKNSRLCKIEIKEKKPFLCSKQNRNHPPVQSLYLSWYIKYMEICNFIVRVLVYGEGEISD